MLDKEDCKEAIATGIEQSVGKAMSYNENREEIFEAIKQGVKEAFHEMMESGDGINGIVRTDEVMEAIRQGVRSSFDYEMPDEKSIKDLIYSAVYDSSLGK